MQSYCNKREEQSAKRHFCRFHARLATSLYAFFYPEKPSTPVTNALFRCI